MKLISIRLLHLIFSPLDRKKENLAGAKWHEHIKIEIKERGNWDHKSIQLDNPELRNRSKMHLNQVNDIFE